MAISIPHKKGYPQGSSSKKTLQILQFLRNVNLSLPGGKKIHSREVMMFTSQVAMMIETGIPINSSIQNIAVQVANPYFKNILHQLVSHLEEGLTLSQAMGRYPEVFPPIYVGMIRTGEACGNLPEMLNRLVGFQKKVEKMMASLRSALAYPVFLVILSMSVIIFILTFVFPKFGSLFEEIRDQLPVTTRFLLFASGMLRGYWLGILGGVGAGIWMALKWMKTPKVKAILDRLYFSIPGVKDFLLKFYISRLMHTLAALLGGGVVLVEALQICRGVGSSAVFNRFLDAIVKSVEEGKGLAHPVSQADFIPDLVKQMVRTGEETGNLPMVMNRIGDYYDEELERRLKIFSTLLEPTLLLVMGAVVGLVVISLILPIFKLSRAIH